MGKKVVDYIFYEKVHSLMLRQELFTSIGQVRWSSHSAQGFSFASIDKQTIEDNLIVNYIMTCHIYLIENQTSRNVNGFRPCLD